MDRVCHFEVPYSDKSRMEKFYSDVFDWQFMPAPGDMPYMFVITTELDESFSPKRPGGINGGSYPRGEGGGSNSPVIVLEVASCEQRIKDVVAAGGAHVLGPHEILGMGIYAQVKDSEGNTIGLWQPLTA
ncbi:MAG: VOC family protein [Planctomycetes bacterium]|nr:VOC family protein [Planctomycetota bacterium]